MPPLVASLRFSALVFCVLVALVAAAVEPIQLSGNRLIMAGASPMASNRIASQLPPQERLVTTHSDDASSSSRLLAQRLSSSVSEFESASFNVKAVAHSGFNRLLDLASSNTLVGFLIGNETTNIFAKAVPPAHDVDDGSAASPRRQLTGMSVALILVMLFFAVWM